MSGAQAVFYLYHVQYCHLKFLHINTSDGVSLFLSLFPIQVMVHGGIMAMWFPPCTYTSNVTSCFQKYPTTQMFIDFVLLSHMGWAESCGKFAALATSLDISTQHHELKSVCLLSLTLCLCHI